jgi:hypothetical protein
MNFGIHNPSWVYGPDPAEAFEGVKAKAQWAENHGFVWFSGAGQFRDGVPPIRLGIPAAPGGAYSADGGGCPPDPGAVDAAANDLPREIFSRRGRHSRAGALPEAAPASDDRRRRRAAHLARGRRLADACNISGDPEMMRRKLGILRGHWISRQLISASKSCVANPRNPPPTGRWAPQQLPSKPRLSGISRPCRPLQADDFR